MLVLVIYNVNTTDAAGREHLRQIARQRVSYGQQAQNSISEYKLEPAQHKLLQAKLCVIMDPGWSDPRSYSPGDRYGQKIKHFGRKQTYLPGGPLILQRARSRKAHLPQSVRTQKT